MNKKLVFSLVGLTILAVGLAILFMPQSATTPGTDKSNTTSESTESTEPAQEASDSPSNVKTVTIDGFAYGPESVTVKVGDTVTWTNKDSVDHTVTADTASSDAPASGSIAKDETYSFTFTKAGTYAYHCEPHPEMKATVVVEE